jgi:pyruvate dehydrogenase E2 component (dihydrolipoamide acetyltransferase)
MRKTIASRLTESKTTIPHYYVQVAVEMNKVLELRQELNKSAEKEGVKISVNDIIVKAVALALRDVPDANTQWAGSHIKKFKHSDVSVAVATDGGLITPIVFRAETLGLLDIARKTKDIAKRAREGKLDPSEFIGGTTTVSNLGTF